MTATLDDVAKKKQAEKSAEQQAAIELVRMAKEQVTRSRPRPEPSDAHPSSVGRWGAVSERRRRPGFTRHFGMDCGSL